MINLYIIFIWMLLEKLDTPKKGGKIDWLRENAEDLCVWHAAAKPPPQKTHLKFSVLEYCMN